MTDTHKNNLETITEKRFPKFKIAIIVTLVVIPLGILSGFNTKNYSFSKSDLEDWIVYYSASQQRIGHDICPRLEVVQLEKLNDLQFEGTGTSSDGKIHKVNAELKENRMTCRVSFGDDNWTTEEIWPPPTVFTPWFEKKYLYYYLGLINFYGGLSIIFDIYRNGIKNKTRLFLPLANFIAVIILIILTTTR